MQQFHNFVCFIVRINDLMKRMILKSVTILTAAVILIATSGFTVFRHSCHVAKTTEISFIIPEFSCDKQQDDALTHSCCNALELPDAKTCGADGCCDTETFLVKLDITFYTQDFSKKAIQANLDQPKITYEEVEIPKEEISHIYINNDLPPPLSGKALLVFLNQLNIPFPSV